ncbi:hypothetical protein AQUCO_02500220v1 [Aquilegia coerulea]|uniref:Uncharacterized protein n=1 Tax=Aquilegia coerulea TaxID=218851 RepID=A0A2G5DA77_AQUCA|nr:hypothetical protein AQUCO_02500220v1 [Aquilegia coerulea]
MIYMKSVKQEEARKEPQSIYEGLQKRVSCVAEDEAVVVKKMGESFRFSAVQAKREEQAKDAHDQAMFGVPIAEPCISTDMEVSIEGYKTG